MAVPRKKVSRMKRGTRRSADALTAPIYVEDKDSGERRRPHHIDLKSGKYRGRQILAPRPTSETVGGRGLARMVPKLSGHPWSPRTFDADPLEDAMSLRALPLIAIPLIIYNIVAVFAGRDLPRVLSATLFTLR